MSRSKWKGNFNYLKKNIKNKKDIIKSSARNLTIVPEFIGNMFMIHTGQHYKKIFIEKNMLGHKLGEFVPTRKKPKFEKKKIKKKR